MKKIKLDYQISKELLEKKRVNVIQGNKRFTIRLTPEFDEKYELCKQAHEDYINEYLKKQRNLKESQIKGKHKYSVNAINTRVVLWLDDMEERYNYTPTKEEFEEKIKSIFPTITQSNLEYYLDTQEYVKF